MLLDSPPRFRLRLRIRINPVTVPYVSGNSLLALDGYLSAQGWHFRRTELDFAQVYENFLPNRKGMAQ